LTGAACKWMLFQLTFFGYPTTGSAIATVWLPAAGGFPSPADDHAAAPLDLTRLLFRHPAATFLARVSGDSMVGPALIPATWWPWTALATRPMAASCCGVAERPGNGRTGPVGFVYLNNPAGADPTAANGDAGPAE